MRLVCIVRPLHHFCAYTGEHNEQAACCCFARPGWLTNTSKQLPLHLPCHKNHFCCLGVVDCNAALAILPMSDTAQPSRPAIITRLPTSICQQPYPTVWFSGTHKRYSESMNLTTAEQKGYRTAASRHSYQSNGTGSFSSSCCHRLVQQCHGNANNTLLAADALEGLSFSSHQFSRKRTPFKYRGVALAHNSESTESALDSLLQLSCCA